MDIGSVGSIGVAGVVLAVVSGSVSFVIGRILSRKRREKKALRDRVAAQAGDSRQVRRARPKRWSGDVHQR